MGGPARDPDLTTAAFAATGAGAPSPVPGGPLAPELAFFAPSAERARRLDARMRERLGASLCHIAERAAEPLGLEASVLESFLARLGAGPVRPQAFGLYCDLVTSLESGELERARAALGELLDTGPADPGLRVLDLRDPARDAEARRTWRMIDTDPTAPFTLRPPDPARTGPFRARIAAAFALLDRGHPELAAELRALLREIVLAVGPDDGGSLVFDGASSFMLWGCIVLNAASHRTRLAMVEALAHESAHNLLFGLAADGALVVDDGAARHASPLRSDARPLDGVYHATFVSARMHLAVAPLLEAGVLEAEEVVQARAALGSHAESFAAGLAVVARHARLSPMGAAALEGARRYMHAATPL